MRRNLKVTLAFLPLAVLSAGPRPASGFNAIHESSYNLEPRGNFGAGTTLSIAGIIDSRATDIWQVPASLALKITPKMELGAGLKTIWGNEDDHVPFLVFGIKWMTRSQTSFQADLLVPANMNTGKGFSLASHHRFSYGSPFSARLAARLGFMEALVENDALMAFEVGFYPTLALGQALSLELGAIGSSQTKGFEENLAMDLQPALNVNFARESTLQAAVALGLAGDRKEEMRVKLTLIHGF
ncbi:MAG: hypothetical protein JWP91_2267 [Fibrobacteres bacterium]|nr:hypothetical protein [Fibrobacterota bacterium]